jgi:hypothetical protein|tara:strand:- start:6563 stop:6751 length:189 start_codon:yes stop_codon:yes gene_type:complete
MSKKGNKGRKNKHYSEDGEGRIFKNKTMKKKSSRKNRHWNKRVGKEFTDGTLGEDDFDFFEN